MLARVTTLTSEEEGARAAFVELLVGIAPLVEGIASCRPVEGAELEVTIAFDPELDTREGVEAGSTRAHLGNLFVETRGLDPEALEARVRHFLMGMVSAAGELPGWEDAQTRIFIAIRSLGYFHTLGATEVVARRSLPLLAECVVLDLGEAMTYVTSSLIERWGATTDAVFDLARQNLETRLEHDLGPQDDDEPPKIFRVTSSDSYESSRIASIAWLMKAREALGAEALVCAIPDRDTLLLAVDVSPPTLVRIADLAEQLYADSTRSISPALYLLTPSGELGPLELIDEHPLRERIRRGHLMLADVEYGAQKIALDAGLEARDPPLFVATYFAVDRDGMVFSYASWAEGVEALLPVVDLMAFTFLDERPPLLVPFEAVAQLCGDLVEEVETLEPVRYHTLGFPDGELLAELARHAIEL